MSLSPDELMNAILLCMMTPMDGTPGEDDCIWGLTPNIIGDPGIAKTALVKQLCREIGLRAVPLFASEHPPEDFAGALIPDGHGDAKQICPLGPVREVIRTGEGAIFLDEINTAPPATQAALQSFIHERRAGDTTLPNTIRILAASNPEGQATGGHRLAPAVANRLVHLDYQGGTHEDWRNWNMTSGVLKQRLSAAALTNVVTAAWNNHFPQAKGLFNGFISRHPTRLHEMPAKNTKESGRAWPSRRTNDFAQRVWATASILGTNHHISEEVRDIVIEGCIGAAAASDFATYQAGAKIPDPSEVLSGTWQIDMTRLDIVIGAYTAMVAYANGRAGAPRGKLSPDAIKVGVKAWEATGRLLKTEPPLTDLVVPVCSALSRAGMGRDTGDPAIKDASAPIMLNLNAAGITSI